MRKILFTLLLLSLAGGVAEAADPPGVIHYQGVLRNASDEPQTGPFAMTFRFFDFPSAGTELLCDSQVVTVTGGLFSAELGKPINILACMGAGNEIPMEALFADHTDIYLQVEVGAEILLPRIHVAAAAYALNARTVRGREIVSDGPMDLYVNGATGDDDNDGLSPDNAKATIGAAIDDLPQILTGEVQIHVSPGTYNERIRFEPRLRRGGLAWIRLLGDEANPNNVVIDGTGVPDPGEWAPSAGIWVSDVPVEIAGFAVRNFNFSGIEVSFDAFVIIRNCRIQNNDDGLRVENSGAADVSDCIVTDNVTGITSFNGGNVYVGGNVDISNNSSLGVRARHSSLIELRELSSCFITNNNLQVGNHSTVSGYGSCTLSSASCTTLDASGLCQP